MNEEKRRSILGTTDWNRSREAWLALVDGDAYDQMFVSNILLATGLDDADFRHWAPETRVRYLLTYLDSKLLIAWVSKETFMSWPAEKRGEFLLPTAPIEEQVHEKLSAIRCPACGNDDLYNIVVLENVVEERRISHIQDGRLVIDGDTLDSNSDGSFRFCCTNNKLRPVMDEYDQPVMLECDGELKPQIETWFCGHEWEMPEWIQRNMKWD